MTPDPAQPTAPTPSATAGPNPLPTPTPPAKPPPSNPAAPASAKPPTAPPPPPDVQALLAEPSARPWYRRPLVWLGAVLLLATGAGAWVWQARRSAQAAPHYNTELATRGKLTLNVTANGTLQPTRAISIGSELSGTVLQVRVDVNDRIRRGQVLVVLDTAKLNDQILRSQAAVTAAVALVAQAQATLLEAGDNQSRLEAVARLSGGQVPSQAELATGRATLSRAQAALTSAQAGVSNADATLSTDRTNLSKASITAPADGVVLTRSVDPGNAVAASLQAVTLFTVAEDLARLRLWVYVDEADVGQVKVGQSASFTVSAYPARAFPARITRVGFGSTITDNVVTYLTYLDVDNTDLSLRPGMTATATIVASQRDNALLVPNAALRFEPTTATVAAKGGLGAGLVLGPPRAVRQTAASKASTASAKAVWVLPDGAGAVPRQVAVTPGISDGRMTEITGGELSAGMAVITSQISSAKP